ncbi:hypothetical protein C0585_02765 [Candidatus Woesearchaeota archaeon]|nr:MAG: hypothetical protein C0585_02765 [Candidatus Woesearchaeota archaeon]
MNKSLDFITRQLDFKRDFEGIDFYKMNLLGDTKVSQTAKEVLRFGSRGLLKGFLRGGTIGALTGYTYAFMSGNSEKAHGYAYVMSYAMSHFDFVQYFARGIIKKHKNFFDNEKLI